MASGSSNGEPSTAPQANRWYDLRLGSSCRDPSPTAKFCTLRYDYNLEIHHMSLDQPNKDTFSKTKPISSRYLGAGATALKDVALHFHQPDHGEGRQETHGVILNRMELIFCAGHL